MKKTCKIISLLLALILLLSACGNGGNEGEKVSSKGEHSEGKLKITAIVNGNLGDKSFFDSLNDGMQKIKKDKGFDVKVVETGFDDTKWEPAIIDAAEGDSNIIIAGTHQMAEHVSNVAKDYPDKKFIVYDTTVDFEGGKNKNVYTIEYKQNEGAYIVGALAAKMSKSGKLGFVGGMDIPVINDFLVGFIDGAKKINSGIKVSTSYIGNFSDTAKSKELAFAQIGADSDVIFPCASTGGLGALEAVKERKVHAVGVDSDQSLLFKEANDEEMANIIYSSVLKEVGNSIIRAIDLEIDGKLPWGSGEKLGIKEGAVGIAKNEYYESNVPADVKKMVDDLENKIKNGELEVKSAFGLSQDELNEIRNSVKP